MVVVQESGGTGISYVPEVQESGQNLWCLWLRNQASGHRMVQEIGHRIQFGNQVSDRVQGIKPEHTAQVS